MWSFPIVRNGLVYVVDIRNGLYVLRYTGRHARKVNRIRFLEGNSNLGDALRLADSSGVGSRSVGRPAQVPASSPSRPCGIRRRLRQLVATVPLVKGTLADAGAADQEGPDERCGGAKQVAPQAGSRPATRRARPWERRDRLAAQPVGRTEPM